MLHALSKQLARCAAAILEAHVGKHALKFIFSSGISISMKGTRNRVFPAALGVALLTCAANAAMALNDPTPMPNEEYENKIHAAQVVSPLGSNFTGEDISLYDRSVSFSVTDVDIPGNNALAVRIGRRFKVIDRHNEGNLPGFGDWDLDLPRIEGTFNSAIGWKLDDGTYNRCTSQAYPDVGPSTVALAVWSGTNLYIPGQGEQELLVNDQPKLPTITDGQSYPWVTANFTRVRCLSQTATGYPGEAFVALTPDGTQYTFDYVVTYPASGLKLPPNPEFVPDTTPPERSTAYGHVARDHVAFLPTRVEDRFANWVTYTYYPGTDKLSDIVSKDGRKIHIDWNGAQISTVTARAAAPASDRQWSYNYVPVTGYAYAATLSTVTLPDQSQWTYSPIGTLKPTRAEASEGGANTECPYETDKRIDPGYHLTIGHPSGATVDFDFSYGRTRRTHTPIESCHLAYGTSGPSPFASAYWDGYQITSKTISGPGLANQNWTYAVDSIIDPTFYYSGTATDPCPSCQQSKVATVTEPDGTYKRYTFGVMYGLNDGKLLKIEQGSGAASPLSTTDTQYISNNEISAQRFPDTVGTSRNLIYSFRNRLRPVKLTTITQDGVAFNSSIPVSNGVYAFDPFGRVLTQLKSSSLGSKTDATTYFDDRVQWVLGQVATASTNGVQVAKLVYDPTTDLPTQFFSFAKATPEHTLSYSSADGTLSTIKDGNGNTTTLSNWKRGIPQTILHPATPEAPAGATESAAVDDNGWIRSVTDENTFTTNYDYDFMGRVKTIIYPTDDSTVWNTTTLAVTQVAASEFGISAGHWKQTISTGTGRKISYFDALLRPLVTQVYDTLDVAGTQRVTRHAYDLGGHESFVSYPGTIDGLATGIHKHYDDALGRPTEVDQDAEPGMTVATKTRYLSGFKVETTTPRLQVITTSYRAYDQPSTDLPVGIAHSAGVYTDIARNGFDKPTAITRRNADSSTTLTRSIVYDGNQVPCKTIEPETGISVTHFDPANNLDWSAAAQSLLNTTDCSDVGSAASRVTRTYDARNHVRSLSFPDGLSDTTYTYKPDEVLATVTALNGGSNPVTTTYGYNKRRMLTSERMQWGSIDWTLGYGYDVNGHLSGQGYPSLLNVDYAPNALGQPTRAGSYATGVSYYPNGAMHQFTYGNGILHTLGQNERFLPDHSKDAFGNTSYLDDGYDYDANGNVAGISDGLPGNRGNRDMTYDGLDRLATATSPMFNGTVATYTYDALDNLKTVKAPGRDHTYLYDSNWRLTNVTNTVGGATVIGLAYDVQGNLATKSGVAFGFDMGNRLRSVGGSPTSSYIYDGQGRRVQDLTTAAKQSMYSFGGQLMYDENNRTSIKSNYIYLNGSLVARDSNTSALGTPTLTVPSADNTGSYTVQWTTLSNASSYALQEQFNGGPWTQIFSGTGTSVSITGKPVGTFSYRVRGFVDAVYGSWSGVASVVESAPTPVPSSSPVLTVPASGPNGSYAVSWTTVSEASSYTLSESANSGAWTTVYSGAGTSLAFSGKASGSYAYRVNACNATGCSAASATGTVQVIYAPASAPSLTVPASSYTGAYTVTWTAVGSATSYALEESANGGIWAASYSGPTLSKAFSAMTAGSHAYRVTACNAAGCGVVSTTSTVQVTYPPSAASTVTTPASSATGSYTVSWTAVGTATSYQLDESVNGGAWVQVQNAAANSRAVTGKTDGSYAYRVKGCNVGGCGPLSATATTVVNYPPPATPTLSAPSTGTKLVAYTVSWSAPTNATSYDLQESVGGVWSVIYSGSARSVQRTHSPGSYGYKVRACSAKGCSAYSATQTTVVDQGGSCTTCAPVNGSPGGGTGGSGSDDDQADGGTGGGA
jgi:hypothetical protein